MRLSPQGYWLAGTVLLLGLLAGCPYVPVGDIVIVSAPSGAPPGSMEAGPGTAISLALYCDYLFDGRELAAGGPSCSGAWGVTEPGCTGWDCDHEGGTATLGFIDACGTFIAPPTRPPEPIVIIATECDSLNCFDACSASVTLGLAGYDVAP